MTVKQFVDRLDFAIKLPSGPRWGTLQVMVLNVRRLEVRYTFHEPGMPELWLKWEEVKEWQANDIAPWNDTHHLSPQSIKANGLT